MPLTAQRFFDFCEKEAREVEAVFILGDLFEYWVGDDANAQSPFHSEVKNALTGLSSRVKTYYMHGNRDFLVGISFLKKTGMTLLTDPCTVQIAGDEYILSHGAGHANHQFKIGFYACHFLGVMRLPIACEKIAKRNTAVIRALVSMVSIQKPMSP